MKKTGKKGSTIAELCVVLALVAIVSAMVVSFSVTMGQRIGLSTARLNVMSDLDAVDNITEGWLGQMKILGAEVSVPTQTVFSTIRAETATGTYTLVFDMGQGVLKGTLPDGGEMVFRPDQLTGIEFSQVEKASQTDGLIFYTLMYHLPGIGGSEKPYEQTFCANPRVGDIYTSGGGAE